MRAPSQGIQVSQAEANPCLYPLVLAWVPPVILAQALRLESGLLANPNPKPCLLAQTLSYASPSDLALIGPLHPLPPNAMGEEVGGQ